MSITLANFKLEISSTVLQRGRDYYRQDHVIELEELDEGRWWAQVAGSEIYDVEIRQGHDGVLDYLCSCPYDWGLVCKHVAAVLYAIEETFSEYLGEKPKPRKQHKKRRTKREKLEEILNSATRDDLLVFAIDLALENRQLYNQLEMRFGSGMEKSAYVRMVKDALKEGQDQYGFIDYWGAGRAAKALEPIFSQAEQAMQEGQPQEAVPILQALIETVAPALAEADDSNGFLHSCTYRAIEFLEEVAHSLASLARGELFAYLLAEAANDKYTGWDWVWELAQVAANLVSTGAERQQVFEILDAMKLQHTSDDMGSYISDRFYFSQAQSIKYSVIQRQDSDLEIERFLSDNVEDHTFREKLVRFYIEGGRLEQAKVCCRQFLDGPEGDHRHHRPMFLELLLEIAQLEKDQGVMLMLAQELFVATYDFKYYDLLKKTNFDRTWQEILKQLLSHSREEILPEIYVREEMWTELLSSARKMEKHMLERHRKQIESKFPEETCDIYERLIYQLLENTSGRKTYREACRYLRRIEKLGQPAKKDQIIEDLKARYPRRRAMTEELDKVR